MGVALPRRPAGGGESEGLGWVEKSGPVFEKGFVLTIDYGYLAKRTLWSHRREWELFFVIINIGLQETL